MSIPFPRQESTTNLSITSRQSTTRATAQEVHELVYGHDAHAQPREGLEAALTRIYEPNASTYENPLLTATSRAAITDISRATRQWAELDMPRLLARGAWFPVLRVWSDVGDICETESFDGHRKSIIEHTLHVLLLPGIHTHPARDDSPLYSLPHLQRSSQPALPVPGTRMTWPSPLHLQLRIISQLHFNGERVTHHRDFWDVKDLVALLPGATITQYVGTRLAARALAAAGRLGTWFWGNKSREAEEWARAPDNTLGLLGINAEGADA